MAHDAPLSPLAPKTYPDMPEIAGVRLASAAAGIRYQGRTDVMIALLDEGTSVAGVFTRSRCASAPVDWCKAKLKNGKARLLLVNSGNANAFTGKTGAAQTQLSAALAASAADVKKSEVFLASTGVIGEPLDAQKFDDVLDGLVAQARPDGWRDGAQAIMTTDTYPKMATRQVMIGDARVTINGIAKGAGMIAPDMATLLSFVFTDAALAPEALQKLLSRGANHSFNCITVDSDTSTSDTLLAFATGAATNAPKITRASDPRLKDFREAFDALLLDLAHQVVRDGEGARKFVEIEVLGAKSAKSAKTIALSVANSPLVKTAIAGEDANWGRVIMAVGKAGEPADRDRLSIWFGAIRVAHKGMRDPSYDEAAVSALMREEKITIRIDLALGDGSAKVWTCDLTKDYVAINGDYRS